jgi:hypothetical protein
MNEQPDPILDSEEGKNDTEADIVKRSLGFDSFKLSEVPSWDLKRKMVLARVLPLLFSGKTYDEISEELHVARSQVYMILKIYYKAVDQNELVDMHWWQLFFWAKKNKPELALNALTQIKLKKMSLNQPTQAEEIVIKWIGNEQDTGNNHQLPPTMGPENSSRQLCTLQDAPLRTSMGQNNVGHE